MSADHIFVYGSLRSEFNTQARSVLKNHAEFTGKATFRGKLFKIDWYPGVVESENPEDIVLGEVYKILDREIVLPKLDQYEGCSSSKPEPHEFIRKQKTVQLQSGETLNAWVYLFSKSIKGKERILSGDYVSN